MIFRGSLHLRFSKMWHDRHFIVFKFDIKRGVHSCDSSTIVYGKKLWSVHPLLLLNPTCSSHTILPLPVWFSVTNFCRGEQVNSSAVSIFGEVNFFNRNFMIMAFLHVFRDFLFFSWFIIQLNNNSGTCFWICLQDICSYSGNQGARFPLVLWSSLLHLLLLFFLL